MRGSGGRLGIQWGGGGDGSSGGRRQWRPVSSVLLGRWGVMSRLRRDGRRRSVTVITIILQILALVAVELRGVHRDNAELVPGGRSHGLERTMEPPARVGTTAARRHHCRAVEPRRGEDRVESLLLGLVLYES